MTTPGSILRTNPRDESIQLGPLCVRFMVTAEDSSSSVALVAVMKRHGLTPAP